MRPTPLAVSIVGAGLVLAFLPALGFGAGGWLWAAEATVVAVLMLADAVMAPKRQALEWSLDAPAVLHVGVPHVLALAARVAGHRDTALEARLDWTGPLVVSAPVRGRAEPGHERIEWTVQPGRRGVARLEAVWLRVRSPLRLWHVVTRQGLEHEVVVLPDVPRIQAEALRYHSDRQFRIGFKTERYVGDGSEFDSLREFGQGDDRRDIDWRSSARHRRLLARHHRAERNHHVILALDTGRLMAEPLGELTRLDHAIHGALLLAHACLRTGDQVGLFTFDERARWLRPPAGGIRELSALIHSAARVDYTRAETNFTLGLTQLGQQLSRRSLVVLLTEFADTISAQLMVENLSRLVRRHVILFVSLRDPVLDRIADEAPASLSQLATAVVTQTLQRDRERVHVDLRRLGVHVLDVPPALVAPRLIRHYLDIRRRELI